MEGQIKIPAVKGKLQMVLQTVSAEDGSDPVIAGIHPCLLHVRRGKGKKWQKHLEPTPNKYHWKQLFEIEDGNLKIQNQLSDHDIELGVPKVDEIAKVKGNIIKLGGRQGNLKLILIQPKQTHTTILSRCLVVKQR